MHHHPYFAFPNAQSRTFRTRPFLAENNTSLVSGFFFSFGDVGFRLPRISRATEPSLARDDGSVAGPPPSKVVEWSIVAKEPIDFYPFFDDLYSSLQIIEVFHMQTQEDKQIPMLPKSKMLKTVSGSTAVLELPLRHHLIEYDFFQPFSET
jgi:hypothetical protein